jgi:hypothetical protein
MPIFVKLFRISYYISRFYYIKKGGVVMNRNKITKEMITVPSANLRILIA